MQWKTKLTICFYKELSFRKLEIRIFEKYETLINIIIHAQDFMILSWILDLVNGI